MIPTEHEEQARFVWLFTLKFPGVRILAIPNGSYKGKMARRKFSAEGLRPGVPDLFVPEWTLWVEMKRQKGGVLSPHQKDWLKYLEQIGHRTIVARGCDDAFDQIRGLGL